MSQVPNGTSSVPLALLQRGRGRKVVPRGTRMFLLGLGGVVTTLLIWELATRSGLVGSSAFPPASETIAAVPALLMSESFWYALGQTVWSTIAGILISACIAIPLGTVIGLSKALHQTLYATIEFLKPIPVVALLPLALLVLGATIEMKLGLIVFGTLWPLLIQVIYGIRNVDTVAWNTANSFRVSAIRRFAFVVIPSAAPNIATGFRVAGIAALLLSVVTELVGAVPGLGQEIWRAQSAVQFDRLYAYVLITGILGVALNLALEWGERKVVFWHARTKEGSK